MKYAPWIALFALSSLNAFADVRPGDHMTSGDGAVAVNGMRGTLNVHITGEAAKVIYDNLTGARETTRRIGSLFLTSRESSDILCTFSAEVAMTYECLFHSDTRGAVKADVISWTMDLRPGDHMVRGQGLVSAGGMRGVINVRLSGEAAKVMYEHLKNARETTDRIGSLLLTNRESDALLATFSAEVAAAYEISFHIDDRGQVLADNVAWPM